MFSALVPSQGEKVVNYPTRPVDTTTDFEGTTSLQPSQPVSPMVSYIYVYIWTVLNYKTGKKKTLKELWRGIWISIDLEIRKFPKFYPKEILFTSS